MIFKGRYCYLEPLVALKHLDDLWKETGIYQDIWQYLPMGGFNDKEEFFKFLQECENHIFKGFFAIIVNEKAVGSLALFDICYEHKRVENGCAFFGKSMQKTRVGTEAIYLLLKHTFEDLQFNRAEWRCNKLNEASKKSALRFGFTFEGCLRNHMEIKGTIRDTLVFSIIKDDWEKRKKALENWLLPNNFDVYGNEKVKLQDFLSSQI